MTLDELVFALPKPSKSTMVMLTPEMCSLLLALSAGNRTMSERSINTYSQAMASGDWEYNGEAIVLGVGYRPLNGHTRMTACVKAGVPFPTQVTVLVKDARVFDRGTSRRNGHEMEMHWKSEIPFDLESGDGKRIESILNPIYYYAAGGSGNPTVPFLVSACKQYGESIQFVLSHRKRPLHKAAIGAGLVLVHDKDAKAAANLVEGAITGALLQPGDPAYALREYATSLLLGVKGNRNNPSVIMAKTIRAGLAEIKGKKLGKLYADSPREVVALLTGGSSFVRSRLGMAEADSDVRDEQQIGLAACQ